MGAIDPNGPTVVADDTGGGVGLFTVCIDPTSFSKLSDVQGVGDAGNCDALLAGGWSNPDSNIGRTYSLLNDRGGLLLYPPGGADPIDGVQWAEGLRLTGPQRFGPTSCPSSK